MLWLKLTGFSMLPQILAFYEAAAGRTGKKIFRIRLLTRREGASHDYELSFASFQHSQIVVVVT